MSAWDILVLVWAGSLVIIVVDAVIFLREAEKRNSEVAVRRVLNSLLTTVPVAPFAALVVLMFWLFAILDGIDLWMIKHGANVRWWRARIVNKLKEYEDKDL